MNQDGTEQPQSPITPPPEQMETGTGTSTLKRAMSFADSIDGEIHDIQDLHTPLSYSSGNISLLAQSLEQSFETVGPISYSPTSSSQQQIPAIQAPPAPTEPTKTALLTPEEDKLQAAVRKYRYTITAALETVDVVNRTLISKEFSPTVEEFEPLRDMMVTFLDTLKTMPRALPENEYEEALPVANKVQLCIFRVNAYMKKASQQPPLIADVAPSAPPKHNGHDDFMKKKIEHFINAILDVDHRWKNVDTVIQETSNKLEYYLRQRESMIANRDSIRAEMKAIDSTLQRELGMDLTQFRPRYIGTTHQPPKTQTSSGK